ncbi:MAG TPA: hypothetical protein VJB98_03065 [Candidatus Paceibacterota bacterium]
MPEAAVVLREEIITLDVQLEQLYATQTEWWSGYKLFNLQMIKNLIKDARLAAAEGRAEQYIAQLPVEFHDIARRYVALDQRVVAEARKPK